MSATTPSPVMVDTQESIIALIDAITSLPANDSDIYVDLEGVSLGRNGTLSLVTIFLRPGRRAYIVDVHTLGATAFSTTNSAGASLKSILESSLIKKVFFDVRNDSDALFSHFGVELQGVEDVQLMENVLRPLGRDRFLLGLEKTIRVYAEHMSTEEVHEWAAVKDEGGRLFMPRRGGSYEVFNERPMRACLVRYCVNDVQHLPELRDRFAKRLQRRVRGEMLKGMVERETRRRVEESQAEGYEPEGKDKAYGPWAQR